MKPLHPALRLLFLLCSIAIWGVLPLTIFFQHYPLSGQITKKFPFDGKNLWFYPFQPGERVSSPGIQPDGWIGQRITAEPVYSTLRLPGPFNEVVLSMEVRAKEQPLAELGILRDEKAFQFEYQPFFSQALLTGWKQAEFQGIKGFVRAAGDPSDLAINDPQRVLTWGVPSPELRLSDTVFLERKTTLDLRGAHDFWIVPVNGQIDMTFVVQDVNRSRASTSNIAAFLLKKGDELLMTDTISVSGNKDEKMSQPTRKRISYTGLADGVYRLSFQADDDFFLRTVETTNRRWVIGPRLFQGDSVGYSTTTSKVSWYTNSQHVVAEIRHGDAKQMVQFGQAQIMVDRLHTPFPLDRLPGDMAAPWAKIEAPKGNIRLVGDGYFAIDPLAGFVPAYRRLTANTDIEKEGIIAIRTDYRTPVSLGDGWYRVQVSFALPYQSDAQRIALGLPGIAYKLGAFDIRHVEISYKRAPLSLVEAREIFIAEVKRAIKRLAL